MTSEFPLVSFPGSHTVPCLLGPKGVLITSESISILLQHNLFQQHTESAVTVEVCPPPPPPQPSGCRETLRPDNWATAQHTPRSVADPSLQTHTWCVTVPVRSLSLLLAPSLGAPAR